MYSTVSVAAENPNAATEKPSAATEKPSAAAETPSAAEHPGAENDPRHDANTTHDAGADDANTTHDALANDTTHEPAALENKPAVPAQSASASQSVVPTQSATAEGPLPPSGTTPHSKYSALSTPQLEAELEEISLGGPIVLLVIGGALTIIGGSMVVAGAAIKSNCVFDTTCQHKGWLTVGIPALSLGVLLGSSGGFFLSTALKKRTRIKETLQSRGATSDARWQLGLTQVSSGQGFEWTMMF